MSRMSNAFFALCLLLPLLAHSSPTYQVGGDAGQMFLFVNIGARRVKALEDGHVHVVKVADMNGDGIREALVSTSCGGNGCPSNIYIVGVRHRKVVLADIGMSWHEPVLKFVDGHPLVEIVDGNKKRLFTFDGAKATPYATDTVRHLHAIAEVVGTGSYSMPGKRTLRTDVDLDGRVDEITCEIWERWGSLLCTLPRPGQASQTSSTGCDRFGALPTTSGGLREFVCGENTVIKFDGRNWVVNSDGHRF